MSVTITPKFLEDSVIFECAEDRIGRYQADGSSESKHPIELPYDQINNLPAVPASFKSYEGKGNTARAWMVEIPIPKCNRVVGFICRSVPENSAGEREGYSEGPYLIR